MARKRRWTVVLVPHDSEPSKIIEVSYGLIRTAVGGLGLGLAAALPAAHAQVSTRSYAPENLRQLSVPDRIRVLETEYREISNGRQLPRDQRDFYLAQIESGWTFSRIKSDMAQSLGGRPGGGWDNG